jgi:hypothetical protein
LTAETSELDPIRPGVERVWTFANEPITHLGISSDGTMAYCGTPGADLITLDLTDNKIARRLDDVGQVLTTVSSSNNHDLFVTNGFGRPGVTAASISLTRVSAYDVVDGNLVTQFVLRRPELGFLGNSPLPPGITTTADGKHLIVPADESVFQVVSLDADAETTYFKQETNPQSFAVVFFTTLLNDGRELLAVDTSGWARFFSLPSGEESRPPRQIIKSQLLPAPQIGLDNFWRCAQLTRGIVEKNVSVVLRSGISTNEKSYIRMPPRTHCCR